LKVVVVAPREHSSWIGGSVLAARMHGARGGRRGQWISKEEYAEAGPTIVHRKCF
jgi:actin-related protein